MPRRQRFKPSRKPKPAIELSDSDVVIPPSKPHDQQQTQPPQPEERREEATR